MENFFPDTKADTRKEEAELEEHQHKFDFFNYNKNKEKPRNSLLKMGSKIYGSRTGSRTGSRRNSHSENKIAPESPVNGTAVNDGPP